MTNFLRKLFIKNFNNIEDPNIRHKHGILAAFVGIFSNALLCIFKLIIGIIVASMTIITDALNNLTDMASCFVNLFGFKMANKPADKHHPYGHERIEYIAGLIISFIIVVIAAVLGYTSIMKIINQESTYYDNKTFIIAIIILVVAILTKLWQGLFYKKIGKIIDSVTLKASSQDSINDVISTSVVLLATILEFILKEYNVHLDGYFGVAVSLFIVVMGIKLIIETSNPLIGETPNNKLVSSVIHDILSYKGVLGIHDLMCHSYGPTKVFMTLHVEVNCEVDVMISHDLIDNIENEMNKKYNILLTIHMDPVDIISADVLKLKEFTRKLISSYNSCLTFHDFRMVKGVTHTNVLFDVVIPFESKIEQSDLLNYLNDEFNKLDKKYNLVIKFDHSYTN